MAIIVVEVDADRMNELFCTAGVDFRSVCLDEKN